MKRETVQCLQHILDEKDSKQLSRDDYREACELALVMLSVQPTRWGDKQRWCAPGAFNNVRWMAKLLYTPKMLAFSDQIEEWDESFKLQLQNFVTFTSYVYYKVVDTS